MKYKIGEQIIVINWGSTFSMNREEFNNYKKYTKNYLYNKDFSYDQYQKNPYWKTRGKIIDYDKNSGIYVVDIGINLIMISEVGMIKFVSLTQSQRLNLMK